MGLPKIFSSVLTGSPARAASRLLGITILITFPYLIVLIAIGTVVIPIMNSELSTRAREMYSIPTSRESRQENLFTVRLRLMSLSEESNSLRVSLFLHSRNEKFREYLKKGATKASIQVTDALDMNSVAGVSSTTLDFETDSHGSIDLKTNGTDFDLYAIDETYQFPFDRHASAFIIMVRLEDGSMPPFNVEVERVFAGRKLTLEGSSEQFRIYLGRTLNEKIIVVGSSVIFLATCFLLLYAIWNDREGLTGYQEALGLAGFVIAAVGFRQFAGLDIIKPRPYLDVILFLPALVVLLLVFSLRMRPTVRRLGRP
jgi:hypothetical protein